MQGCIVRLPGVLGLDLGEDAEQLIELGGEDGWFGDLHNDQHQRLSL